MQKDCRSNPCHVLRGTCTSVRHGWRECKRIAGASLAVGIDACQQRGPQVAGRRARRSLVGAGGSPDGGSGVGVELGWKGKSGVGGDEGAKARIGGEHAVVSMPMPTRWWDEDGEAVQELEWAEDEHAAAIDARLG